jgi:hypothetical protein
MTVRAFIVGEYTILARITDPFATKVPPVEGSKEHSAFDILALAHIMWAEW